MEAIGARCDVFREIEVHVIESRDKGGKSLRTLGLSRPRVVIFDDSLNARPRRPGEPRSGGSRRAGTFSHKIK